MRRVGCGLEDDRVPGHQRRHRLPGRDRHREVPGRDDAGNPDRLADAHRPLVGQLRRDGVAEHAASLAGHQLGDVDRLLDVAAGLGEDLAHLPGKRPREALLVATEQAREAEEDLAAARGGRRAPGRQRRLGGPDRHRDVGRRAGREAAHEVRAIGGVATLERPARTRFDPLPGDEVMPANRAAGVGRGRSRLRHARTPWPPIRPRPGRASPGRSDPAGGEARGAASPRSSRRTPRWDARGRWHRRSR